MTPRLEINLSALSHNARQLVARLAPRGIALTAVTKVTLGDPVIARLLLDAGATSLGDSRIENIRKMRDEGISAPCMLLRSPAPSQVDDTVRYADISLNTELEILTQLSRAAVAQGRQHKVILMAELGDLREGILTQDLCEIARQCHTLDSIELLGIGTNLACFGGVRPALENMDELSWLAREVEASLGCQLQVVTGGNSANFNWLDDQANPATDPLSKKSRINNLRLGEAIYLGCETLNRTPLDNLRQDAFTLVTEVIESKVKPSVPRGDIGLDAFGKIPVFEPRGNIQRSILDIGRQDISPDGLTPLTSGLEILGASSDHLILNSQRQPLKVGDEVRFRLDYAALLMAMTSPFVSKVYL